MMSPSPANGSGGSAMMSPGGGMMSPGGVDAEMGLGLSNPLFTAMNAAAKFKQAPKVRNVLPLLSPPLFLSLSFFRREK